ncbi:MAG: hypothetical protein Q9187_000654 [Circinaria calcarea]
MATASPASIPVVDLSSFTTKDADIATRRQTAKEVAEKCSVNGCLAITGHNVPPELLEEAFNLTRHLFDLPMEEKMKAPHPAGLIPHRGYSAPGKERAFQKEDHDASDAKRQEMLHQTQDWKESYEVGDDANKKDYNIWLPEITLPGFRQQSSKIFERLRELSFAVLEALIIGMEVTKQEHAAALDMHSGPVGQLRLLHYPLLVVDRWVMEEANRLPAHTDWSSFTLSFQDATGGLEFLDRHTGAFMPVTPRSDAVYLNIGDMMERLSNVDGNGKETAPPRYSVIFFLTVNEEAVVAPPASRVEKDGQMRFEPTTYKEYAEERSKWHYEDYEKK